MPFKINNEALYPLYNMPHTQLAIEYCVKVVELWPLQTAGRVFLHDGKGVAALAG